MKNVDFVYALFAFRYSFISGFLFTFNSWWFVLCRVLAMMTTGLGGAPGTTPTGMTGAAVGVLEVAATDRRLPHDEGQYTSPITPSWMLFPITYFLNELILYLHVNWNPEVMHFLTVKVNKVCFSIFWWKNYWHLYYL